jgi:uncharacterized protein
VPGAQVLERTGENSYKVGIKVKVGPMSMLYRGDVEIAERDDEAHRAVMKARAKETRGQGTADADVTMMLDGADGHTSASVTTDVELSGKAAAMGQGVLQDVARRLVETFAENLAAMLAGREAPALEPEAPAAEPEAPAAEPQAPAAEPAAAAPEQAAPHEEALDLGSLGGAVIAGRLQDPRRLAALIGLVALIAFLLGRRSARA